MSDEEDFGTGAPVSGGSDQVDSGRPELEDWILKEGTRLGSTVATLVYEIDLMLQEARKVLKLAQPSVAGKIDLRWWKGRKGRGREPYVFEWAVRGNGQWFCKRLPEVGLARHAKRGGIFKEGAEQTRAALSEIERLMNQRRDLLGAYGRARQVLGNKVNGTKALLSKVGGTLEQEQRLAAAARGAPMASGSETPPESIVS